jgi:hypothetical protein
MVKDAAQQVARCVRRGRSNAVLLGKTDNGDLMEQLFTMERPVMTRATVTTASRGPAGKDRLDGTKRKDGEQKVPLVR